MSETEDAGLQSCRGCGGLFEAGRGHTVTTPDGFEYPYCDPGCLVESRGWRS